LGPAFCFVIIALAITAIWSIVGGRAANHVTVHKWFRLFLRFALGSTMLSYGSAKVIPLQMSFPSLTRLLEPYGTSRRWACCGHRSAHRDPMKSSPARAEISAAILLFIPRTASARRARRAGLHNRDLHA
jgi:hypothetical protein